jgi:hypothetical protein
MHQGKEQGGKKAAPNILGKPEGAKTGKDQFKIMDALGDKNPGGAGSPVKSVHPEGRPGRFGFEEHQGTGPGEAGVEQDKKEDNQDNYRIYKGKINSRPQAQDRLQADLIFRQYLPVSGGVPVFFSKHGRIIGPPPMPCQRWRFVVIFYIMRH